MGTIGVSEIVIGGLASVRVQLVRVQLVRLLLVGEMGLGEIAVCLASCRGHSPGAAHQPQPAMSLPSLSLPVLILILILMLILILVLINVLLPVMLIIPFLVGHGQRRSCSLIVDCKIIGKCTIYPCTTSQLLAV